MARSSASSKALTDHDEIRRWAEQRNARPATVRSTGGGDDVGMIRPSISQAIPGRALSKRSPGMTGFRNLTRAD